MSLQFSPFYDQVVFDNSGNLATGGTLNAYYTGTSNPAPIYNENGSEISQPIVISSNGRVIYKLDTNLIYRIVIQDSMGVTIRDADGVAANGSESAGIDTVKVSSSDTVSQYLGDKIVAGTDITVTKLTDAGGVETLQISASHGGGEQTLQEVTDLGNTTDKSVIITSGQDLTSGGINTSLKLADGTQMSVGNNDGTGSFYLTNDTNPALLNSGALLRLAGSTGTLTTQLNQVQVNPSSVNILNGTGTGSGLIAGSEELSLTLGLSGLTMTSAGIGFNTSVSGSDPVVDADFVTKSYLVTNTSGIGANTTAINTHIADTANPHDTDLQKAYNEDPEIITTSVLGPVKLKGSSPDTNKVLAVDNSAGAEAASITGGGKITSQTLDVGGAAGLGPTTMLNAKITNLHTGTAQTSLAVDSSGKVVDGSSLSGGQVNTVSGGTNITVTGTAVDPIVNLDASVTNDIATNAANITANTNSITANDVDIANNTAAITSNTNSITANDADITTNANAIAANTTLANGKVASVTGGTNINVTGTTTPTVNLDASITGMTVNNVTLSNAGPATEYLDKTGNYSTPAGGGGSSYWEADSTPDVIKPKAGVSLAQKLGGLNDFGIQFGSEGASATTGLSATDVSVWTFNSTRAQFTAKNINDSGREKAIYGPSNTENASVGFLGGQAQFFGNDTAAYTLNYQTLVYMSNISILCTGGTTANRVTLGAPMYVRTLTLTQNIEIFGANLYYERLIPGAFTIVGNAIQKFWDNTNTYVGAPVFFRNSSLQTTNLNTISWASIAWDDTTFIKSATGITHSISSFPSRVQVDEDGTYEVYASAYYTSPSSQRMQAQLSIWKNGTFQADCGFGQGGYARAAGSADNGMSHIKSLITLGAGDYIEIYGRRDTIAGTTTLIPSSSNISITKLQGAKGDIGATGAASLVRTVTTTTTVALATNADTTDIRTVTALTSAMLIQNPTGTPINGQVLKFRITDSGGSSALLSYGGQFRFFAPKPLGITSGKTLYIGCIYNTEGSGTWDVVAAIEEI